MAINTFDDKSTARIGSVVRKFEKSVLGNPNPTRRRIPLSGSGDVSTHPFKMSLKKDDADNQLVTMESGRVIIEGISSNSIESNSVDISGESVGTLYIYLKVEADWSKGGTFNGYPSLTVKTGEEITDTNFASNSTKFPETDADNYFYAIGAIVITEENSIKKYELNQIAITDSEFTPFTMNAFSVNRILAGKANDEAVDTNFELFVNGGQVVLPDGVDNLTTISENVVKAYDGYAYLEIQGTQTVNGGWENFSSTTITSNAVKANTDDFNYFMIARITEGRITKGFDGNFESGGRIY